MLAPNKTRWDRTTDVVVIGYGLAGGNLAECVAFGRIAAENTVKKKSGS